MKRRAMVIAMLLSTSVSLANTELKYNQQCEDGQSLTISFVGDVLPHETLQRRAIKEGSYQAIYQDLIPYFEKEADLSYANLEGAVAEGVNKSGKLVEDPGFTYDGKVYSSYPRFNYHRELIWDLKSSGIDVVSTANNHSLDRFAVGVDRTIDNLKSARLPFAGTRKQEGKARLSDWFTVTKTNGMRITWVSCTFRVNWPFRDEKNQVLYCFTKYGSSQIEKIIKQQKRRTDAVIITPHWGDEYTAEPRERAKVAARKWIELGATAVMGSHPHVLQRMEKHVAKDGREGLILYSLGNFISNQGSDIVDAPKRTTVAAFLNLKKTKEKTIINGIKLLPMRMTNQYDTENVELKLIPRSVSKWDENLAMAEEDEFQADRGLGRRELKEVLNHFPKENLVFPGEEFKFNQSCQK